MNYNLNENKNDTRIRLSDEHKQMLRNESGIAENIIEERGYRTVTNPDELKTLGFSKSQRRVPGLLMPVFAPDGAIALYQFRPNEPRINSENQKPIKYETPYKAEIRIDCPQSCRVKLADPKIPIWITEGIKKGDSLASQNLCTIALLGVWNFKGKNKFGGTTISTDFDYIAWKERDVRIVFDSDIMHKPSVRQAMERLKEILERKEAKVSIIYLPDEGDNKTGVDDYLQKHSVDELEKLVSQPKPKPKPREPIFEVLDAAPNSMRRPLQLIEGRAYAAVLLYVKKIVTETVDENNNLVQFNPPKETTSREIRLIRDDGKMFGYGTENPLSQLDFEIVLPETIQEDRLFSPQAVRDTESGIYSEPIEIFEQIGKIINHFFDFSRSLTDQKTMCELVTAYIFATWFIEGFTVAGYLWITGGRGSGKTQLLNLISELAYLGQVILASSSTATLRDLADCAAFLGFDDAENFSSAKNTDPDKRALLLAGNRRGNNITVKEPIPGERGWRTRFVSTFCHRAFTATSRPEAILSSRTVVIPLVRTSDRKKANTDPLDEKNWEVSPKALRSKLWQIALKELPKIQYFDREVNKMASISGRNLEAWRGILSVAMWLDSHDKGGNLRKKSEGKIENTENIGLFSRLNSLSQNYQMIRDEFESNDLTRIVLKAIVKTISIDSGEVISAEKLRQKQPLIYLLTKEITENAKKIIDEEELDFNEDWVTDRKVGRAIKQLRLASKRQGGTGKAGWEIKMTDLENLLDSYDMLQSSENLPIDSVDSNSSSLISLSSHTLLPLFAKCEISEISEQPKQNENENELKTIDVRWEDDSTLI